MGAELSSQSQQQHQQRRRQQQQEQARGSTPLQKEASVHSLASEPDHPFAPSEISKPIGGPAADRKQQQKSEHKAEVPKEIVIVSKGETEEETVLFTFPPAFKPLIPIGHETLPPGVPAVEHKLLYSLGNILQASLKFKSEFLLSQQLVLADIGKDIESYSSYVSNQTISERSKRFNRIADNFSRLQQVHQLLEKIDADLETCFQRIKVLNDFLPEEHQLEPFSPPSITT